MNPLTNMKNVLKLSDHDLRSGAKTSWHDMYKGSAWIFVAGFPYTLTEGDIVCVFSQYGEIVNINLIRDKSSGKSKGFCFLCYEDQRSTILAVDNLNGIKILGRSLRVDHVADYKPPKEGGKTDEETLRLYMEGCAPKPQLPEVKNVDPSAPYQDKEKDKKLKKNKKHKKHLKKKSKKRKKEKRTTDTSSESNTDDPEIFSH